MAFFAFAISSAVGFDFVVFLAAVVFLVVFPPAGAAEGDFLAVVFLAGVFLDVALDFSAPEAFFAAVFFAGFVIVFAALFVLLFFVGAVFFDPTFTVDFFAAGLVFAAAGFFGAIFFAAGFPPATAFVAGFTFVREPAVFFAGFFDLVFFFCAGLTAIAGLLSNWAQSLIKRWEAGAYPIPKSADRTPILASFACDKSMSGFANFASAGGDSFSRRTTGRDLPFGKNLIFTACYLVPLVKRLKLKLVQDGAISRGIIAQKWTSRHDGRAGV